MTLSMRPFYPLWAGRPTFAATPPRIKVSIGGKGLPWLDSTSAAPGTLLLRECTTAGAGTRRYGKKPGGSSERSQVALGKEARAAPPRQTRAQQLSAPRLPLPMTPLEWVSE